MFDLLNPAVTHEQLNKVSFHHAVNNYALFRLLVQKGIITEQEFVDERIRAMHVIEQSWTQLQDQSRAEFDVEHPGLRENMKKFGMDL